MEEGGGGLFQGSLDVHSRGGGALVNHMEGQRRQWQVYIRRARTPAHILLQMQQNRL